MRKPLLCVVTLVAALAAPSSAAAKDYALIARDIIPSGEPGNVPVPAGATRQPMMYDTLTPRFTHVTSSQLPQLFKPETLGVATPGPATKEPVPRAGVRITRDGFDVPRIVGKTHDDVTLGAGWC